MRHQRFGATQLSVSEVGVGCSRLGGVFSAGRSQRDEIELLRDALGRGLNFFDTADLYSHGQSEVILGKAVKGHRAEAIIASKGGYVVPTQSRLLARAKPLLRPVVQRLGVRRPGGGSGSGNPAGTAMQDFSPGYLAAAVEASLRRLGTDYIDIYQLHSPPASVVEGGDFVSELERLQAQGKIRHFGLAGDRASDLEAFDRLPGVASLQLPVSVMEQQACENVLPRALELGVGVISRSCFGAGLLVGDLTDEELRERTPDWPEILAFRSTAERLGRPRKELALQFNLACPGVSVTVIGMSRPAQLDEIVRLADAPALTGEERQVLTQDPPIAG